VNMTYEASLHASQIDEQQLPLSAAQHANLAFVRKANLAFTLQTTMLRTTTMQKVQAHDEDDMFGSGSGSGLSDTSALDNATDTLGQQIMQHERDARRLRSALDAGSRPLLKTRARPRISELVERREREEVLAATREHDRVDSSGSNESDPPLNVPREWGTRARSHRGWMRKIREPSEASIQLPEGEMPNVVQKADEDAIVPRRTVYTGDDYHSPLGDDALPSMEMTPPSMTRARLASEPASLQSANDRLRHIMDSEEQDFSELPLMESTPAVPRTLRRLENCTTREIETLERQGVSSRTLDQLSERSPNNSLRRRRSRESATTAITQNTATSDVNDHRPTSAPSGSVRNRITRRKSLIGNKENVPSHGVGSSHYKGAETVTITDRTAKAVTFKQAQRPGHARQDSMKLLQRLARVSSMSPSPGRPSPQADGAGSARGSQEKPVHASSSQVSEGRANAAVKTAERNVFATSTERRPQPQSPTKQNDLPIVSNGNHVDTEGHDDTEQGVKTDVTPAHTELPASKTPIVTGAWVDTPAGPDVDIRPLLHTTDSTILRAFGTPSALAALSNEQEQDLANMIRRTNSEPSVSRPRSALEDIVREARSQPNGPFGDATIQSLEDIVHPNLDATETTLTFDEAGGHAAQDEIDVGERELTQSEKDRRQEDLAIESMNKHLRAARTSIKDADRGLRRVENRVGLEHEHIIPETLDNTPPALAVQTKFTSSTAIDPSPSTWRTECTHCGGSYRSIWSGLLSETLSTIYTRNPSSRLGFQLTWFGTLLLLFLSYQTLEQLLCSLYCHDFSIPTMRGFGVDPDAPRYPFVIPTLAFRPLRPLWRPMLNWTKEAWMAGFHAIVGEEVRSKNVPIFMRADFEITPKMIRWEALTRTHQSAGAAAGAPASGRVGSVAGRLAKTVFAGAAATAVRASRSFVEAVDDVGDLMGDDEYLS